MCGSTQRMKYFLLKAVIKNLNLKLDCFKDSGKGIQALLKSPSEMKNHSPLCHPQHLNIHQRI